MEQSRKPPTVNVFISNLGVFWKVLANLLASCLIFSYKFKKLFIFLSHQTIRSFTALTIFRRVEFSGTTIFDVFVFGQHRTPEIKRPVALN